MIDQQAVIILESIRALDFTPIDDDYFDKYVGNYLVRVQHSGNGEVRIWLNEFNEVGIWSQTLLNAPASVVIGAIKLAIADAKSR